MNELVIKLKGEVTDTNFDEWKNELIARVKNVNTELVKDDDFAIAEDDVKAIKAGEKALKAAKASALEQADEIQKLFAAIDEVSSEARDARLALERQIKKRKSEIKDEIVDEGVAAIEKYLQEQSAALQSINHSWLNRSAIEETTKGKRTSTSMQKAVTTLVVKIKGEIAEREDAIKENETTISDIDDSYSAIFQDAESLALLDADELKSTIEERIEYFEEEKKKQQPEPVAETTTEPKEEEPEPEPEESEDSDDIHPADESHVISIEIFAQVDAAQELFDEIDDRYSNREIVGEIRLS